VILVGVIRSGKTPTSLYLAMQFGVKAANYPLIPEDFERNKLPVELHKYRGKLFGLTIAPSACRRSARSAAPTAATPRWRTAATRSRPPKADARENIRWLDSTTKSIEEISATILQTVRVDRPASEAPARP
jgi:regulator of PEP synthase PpsR (kinase-PPPase family)